MAFMMEGCYNNGGISMSNEYKMISEFCCCGKSMGTVMIGNAAHAMSQEEWYKVNGRSHQDKQETKIDWFVTGKKCSQSKVS